MKPNKVFKSLAELSPELLGAEAAWPEQIKPRQAQAVMQETQEQTPQPAAFPASNDIRGQHRWGINE